MKHKRLIILVALMSIVSGSIFLIYKNTYKEEFNYVVLGDSLSSGRNPYGVDDYGYTDYIKDYLKSKNKLNSYVSYAVSGYSISNVVDDINYNRMVEVENNDIGLKKALRESDLVTISIGANDLLGGMNLSSFASNLSDKKIIFKTIDEVMKNMKYLLELIKQYAKGDIIVVGYYNPVPNLTKYKNAIDEVIYYVDTEYQKLCDSIGVYYVKISHVMDDNGDYLPNPLDIHPSKLGYKAISNEVINTIENKLFK